MTKTGRVLWWLILAMAALGADVPHAPAAQYLLWDKAASRVDAEVRTWDVGELLKRVAAQTRWQIYLQPGVRQVVPARFKNLSEGEALRRLLGDLNFALIPQTNGPARLYVFRNSRSEATELVRPQPEETRPKPIEDELVVRLKPGESIEELARRLGAKVLGKVDGLNAYRLKFDSAEQAARARQSLRRDSSVAAIDYNYLMPRPDAPDEFGLGAPRLPLTPKAPPPGQEIIIGLVDSAVQMDAGGLNGFVLNQLSVSGQPVTPPADEPTHGTAMAQTILNGLASALQADASTVRILPVDIYGHNPTTTTFDVALGVSMAINNGARIINLSLAGEGDSAILRDVIRAGHEQGIIFFAAAGNEPVSTTLYPAGWPETIGVTAVDPSGRIAAYANRSAAIDAAGPSSVPITFYDRTYIVTGTSASTAYVSGVAAGLAESTGQPLREIERAVPTLLPVNPARR